MRIWIDLVTPPDVNLFLPIMRRLDKHQLMVTTRSYAEVERLLAKYGIEYMSIGTHYGENKLAKGLGLSYRTWLALRRIPGFDVSIAHLSALVVFTSIVKGKPSISFSDNDLPMLNMRLSAPFLDHFIVPSVFDGKLLDRYGINHDRVFRYNGFKEDVYLADYHPDPSFPSSLPFKEYVVVRPEAFKAEYVPSGVKSLVPDLLKRLEDEGIHVLYLPRYPEDRMYARGRKNVYTPPGPVNGMDACYHSRGVLTGSGTFAREGAILGIPSVSFFPGERLLSVDREMIKRGWMIHSRDVNEIIEYILTAERRGFDRERSSRVRDEVIGHVKAILDSIGERK